jgi:4-amino-4-deoxy-L-arabinose transferase-like glycosyltransferase
VIPALRGLSRRPLLWLLLLALAVRWIGVDHEVAERYYLDEGTYIHHAQKILGGELIERRFVYPHLLYYLYALLIWVADRAEPLFGVAVRLIWGVEEPLAARWLLCRLAVATLSALAVVPVYRMAARLAGSPGGVAAGALWIACPSLNQSAHLLISDAPAAAFAAFALERVSRLVERESWRDYLWAGFFSGLAAGTKYPAGTVAVAIVAVWIWLRLRRRDWNSGLAVAGAAALGAFLLTTPSILVHFRHALFGGQGIFFGVRQYGGGGWIGVMPHSNAAFYGEQLASDWGWPALVAGVAGWWALEPLARKRALLLAPFPIAYLLLVAGAMNMVVVRNLFPALPALAALLGAGVGALAGRIRRPAVAALGLVLVLAWPAGATALQTVALARDGTRVLARDWMLANLPGGARLFKESYTPEFPESSFAVSKSRFAARVSFEDLEAAGIEYVLLSENAFGRFFSDDVREVEEHHREFRAAYERMFREFELVREWRPSRVRDGPRLLLYRRPRPPQ